MERVEAADPARRLAGLEHMLKGEDRLKEKIAEMTAHNPDLRCEQALDTNSRCSAIHTHIQRGAIR